MIKIVWKIYLRDYKTKNLEIDSLRNNCRHASMLIGLVLLSFIRAHFTGVELYLKIFQYFEDGKCCHGL